MRELADQGMGMVGEDRSVLVELLVGYSLSRLIGIYNLFVIDLIRPYGRVS
jgi:hypothetical protein